MTEMTDKKMSGTERAHIQRNADAVERHIVLLNKRIELLKKLNDVKQANYNLHKDYKPTMTYQEDAEFLAISKEMDNLNSQEEIEKYLLMLDERKDKLKQYQEILKERA